MPDEGDSASEGPALGAAAGVLPGKGSSGSVHCLRLPAYTPHRNYYRVSITPNKVESE